MAAATISNDNTAKGDSANAAGSTDPDNPIGYTYDHGLFIADYNVTRRADWNNLNRHNLIFGKAYTSSGVDYILRVPSAGSSGTASGGTPASNEWDAILDKANQNYQDNTVGYIKNWNGMDSWGQDTQDGPDPDWNRATRGSFTARSWQFDLKLSPSVGFRPVLELPSSDTLGSDGLKAITLDLNGGKIGGSSDDIQIIVKNGSAFTAPASDGLTRPDGDTGDFFMWLGSDGNLYAPGESVPAGVTTLTAQFAVPSYTVTLNTNGGTINNGNVTGYTYGQGATLPTADDMTYTGHTFKGWYDNKALTGNPVTEISDTETGNKEYWAKWEANTYTVTLNGVNSDATGAGNYAVGVTVNIYAGTKSGYSFNGWTSDNVTITNANNKNASFIMPAKDVAVTANWKKNSSGGTGHTYYTIKAIAGAGGTISPSGNAAVLYGRNKTFTITPDNGYAIADVKIDGQSIGAVKTYTFERVKGDHTIEAVFMKATGNPQAGVDVPFTDVSETDWFYEDVAYVYTNNLMNGTSTTMFSPNTTTTRGMIVTILYRLEGEPSVSDNCHFADVKSGSYYEKAITWAAAKGIVSGYGNNQFGPDDPITREQMAVILFRYAQYKGLDVSAGEDTNILSYSDALDISEYAFPAMQWICGESILNGSDGNLMPRGSATRAQVAAILHRFCENILK